MRGVRITICDAKESHCSGKTILGLTQTWSPNQVLLAMQMRSWHPRRGWSRKELWPDKRPSNKGNQVIWGRRMGMAARQSAGRCKQSVSAQYIIWKEGHGSLEEPWERSEWALVGLFTTASHACTLTCMHAHTHKHTRAPLRHCLRAALVYKHTLWPLLLNVRFLLLQCSYSGKLPLVFKQFKHHHLQMVSQSHSHIPSTLTQTSFHTCLCVPYNWHILYPGAFHAVWQLSVCPKRIGGC